MLNTYGKQCSSWSHKYHLLFKCSRWPRTLIHGVPGISSFSQLSTCIPEIQVTSSVFREWFFTINLLFTIDTKRYGCSWSMVCITNNIPWRSMLTKSVIIWCLWCTLAVSHRSPWFRAESFRTLYCVHDTPRSTPRIQRMPDVTWLV